MSISVFVCLLFFLSIPCSSCGVCNFFVRVYLVVDAYADVSDGKCEQHLLQLCFVVVN